MEGIVWSSASLQHCKCIPQLERMQQSIIFLKGISVKPVS